MKRKTFEHILPEGYVPAKIIDAKDKKIGIILNLVALLIAAVVVGIAFYIVRPTDFFNNYDLPTSIVIVLCFIVYMVLHELTHGLAYKLMTHQKLTFGLTLTVAYCGVPQIYTYRKTALVATAAPLVLFSIILTAAFFLVSDPWYKIYVAFIFAAHLGGCAGDIYVLLLLTTKLRDPLILIQDTGPKQTFYKKA